MVELIEIEKGDLPWLVYVAYKDDKDLWNKYHVEKLTLVDAVVSTLKMVEISAAEMELNYYKVRMEDENIGYVVVSGNHLYSFGINIHWRTKEILKEWWELVTGILGESFTCLLFSNNERAIKYLKNRGMEIKWQNTEHEELNEVLLTYKFN